MIIEDAGPFLSDGDWRRVFDSHTLVQGDKLMRGRQVSAVRAELLETGDLEIVGQVGVANIVGGCRQCRLPGALGHGAFLVAVWTHILQRWKAFRITPDLFWKYI